MNHLEEYWRCFLVLLKQQLKGISAETLMLTVLAAVIAIHLIWFVFHRLAGKEGSKRREAVLFLIAGYACFMYQVTLYNREPNSRKGVYTELDFGNWSGDYMGFQQRVYSLLNVALFVPWGFLLAAIRGKECMCRKIFMGCSASFLTSFTIETLQLITGRGYFELTDMITNVSGGLLGVLIFCAAWAVYSKKYKGCTGHENKGGRK